MSSSSRAKRQFQPSLSQPTITSHFRPTPPTEEIQANLLSVGMRVRKSVPEGYKTHKTLPPTLQYTSSAPAELQPRAPRSLVRTASGQMRELRPFCGLHKVGGWAMQDDDEDDEEEEVPGLVRSQGTVLWSSQGSFRGEREMEMEGNVRKRGYEEDVEEEMDAFFEEMDAVKEMRPMARMRGSGNVGKRKDGLVVRVVGGADGDGDDFEEAAFLAPVEGMEVDG